MDLDPRLDAIYQAPLDQFIRMRDELVGELKKAGRREDATRVKGLAKPPVAAWAVNQLAAQDPVGLNALHAAGKALRRAQEQLAAGGGPGAMALAQDERRQALKRLIARATEILVGAGHGAAAGTMQRVSATLEALAAAAGAGALVAGRLGTDLAPPGFEALAGLAFVPSAPARPGDAPSPAARAAAPAGLPGPTPEQVIRMEEALRSARSELATATTELGLAAEAQARARTRVDKLEAELSTARRDLAGHDLRLQAQTDRKSRAEGEVARAEQALTGRRGPR